MADWQPMEIAPKDGSEILLAVSGKQYRCKSAFWSQEHRVWAVAVGASGRVSYIDVEPDAWMPLPSPPDAKP